MSENGSGRLDRIESILQELAERQRADHEEFTRDHQQLLKWQVLTQDRIDRLFDLTDRNAAQIERNSVQIGQLSDRIDKLVIAIGS
jgi:hypothetical protein